MTFALVVAAVTSAYYFFFVVRVIWGLRRLTPPVPPSSLDTVTVIVAARNEEDKIGRCIESVLSQEYPSDLLRLIVVDDGSEDATAAVVISAAQADARVQLLSLPPQAATGIGRKPEAIRMAVERSASTLVVTTDADCQHDPRWLRALAGTFRESTALVAGPVALREGSTLFSRIERMDFLGLVASGAGLIGAGRPIICNGANLAYRREVYLKALDRIQHSSNDDGTLMSRIVTRGLGGVRFAHAPEAVVNTPGQDDIRSFFRQRRRWAAVRGRFLDPTIYVELSALFLFFLTLIAATVLAPGSASWRTAAVIMWIGKVALDWQATSQAASSWGVGIRISDFVAAELFHPISIVLATLGSVVAPFHWKGRTLAR